MKFTLNETVKSLVPETVLAQVQNGLDTEFSEAERRGEVDGGEKWKGKVRLGNKDGTKPTRYKIGRKTTSEWLLRENAPGRLVLLSIYMDSLEADCGTLSVAGLPDWAESWFKRLEAEAKKNAPAPAPKADVPSDVLCENEENLIPHPA